MAQQTLFQNTAYERYLEGHRRAYQMAVRIAGRLVEFDRERTAWINGNGRKGAIDFGSQEYQQRTAGDAERMEALAARLEAALVEFEGGKS